MNRLGQCRVYLKLFLRKYCGREQSFCKVCGRDYHYDFICSDKLWEKVDQNIPLGHTVCYYCFCQICDDNNYCLPTFFVKSVDPAIKDKKQ